MSVNPIRVGISGLGRSGHGIHHKALSLVPEQYTICGVYDPIQERAAEVAAAHGATEYDSFDALIAAPDIELIVVASPNRMHAPQATQALRAGKHVLCEKPFGLTLEDVDTMIAAASESGKVLQPFQQRRFEPDFQKVKEICDSGILGEIKFIRICWHGFKRRWDWQTMRVCGGGALNNNGPHPLDHAMVLFGEGEPEVQAEASRNLCSGDAEDHLKVTLSGAGHPTVEVELSDIVAFGQDRWLVCGTAGGLRGNAKGLEWKWVDWSTMPPRPADPNPTPDRGYNSEQLDWQSQSWERAGTGDAGAGAAPAQQPVFDLYESLRAAVRDGSPQLITPQNVRQRVAVMEKIRSIAGFPAFTDKE